MNILAPISLPSVAAEKAVAALAAVKDDLAAGRIVPYLGPSLLAQGAAMPTTPEALALALHAKVPVSGRIRGNLWAAAQFIGKVAATGKTLTALMTGIFRRPRRRPRSIAILPVGACRCRRHLVRRRHGAALQESERAPIGARSRASPARANSARSGRGPTTLFRRRSRCGRRRRLDHDPLQAARRHHLGGEFLVSNCALCRGADRDQRRRRCPTRSRSTQRTQLRASCSSARASTTRCCAFSPARLPNAPAAAIARDRRARGFDPQ